MSCKSMMCACSGACKTKYPNQETIDELEKLLARLKKMTPEEKVDNWNLENLRECEEKIKSFLD